VQLRGPVGVVAGPVDLAHPRDVIPCVAPRFKLLTAGPKRSR
jgi:hypothetical protein